MQDNRIRADIAFINGPQLGKLVVEACFPRDVSFMGGLVASWCAPAFMLNRAVATVMGMSEAEDAHWKEDWFC